MIERLASVLRAERDSVGTAMLLVEQNVSFALSIADRYAEASTMEEMFNDLFIPTLSFDQVDPPSLVVRNTVRLNGSLG